MLRGRHVARLWALRLASQTALCFLAGVTSEHLWDNEKCKIWWYSYCCFVGRLITLFIETESRLRGVFIILCSPQESFTQNYTFCNDRAVYPSLCNKDCDYRKCASRCILCRRLFCLQHFIIDVSSISFLSVITLEKCCNRR